MKEELVTFKGIKEGIYINIDGDDFSSIKKELDYKLHKASGFYKGTKLLGIRSKDLSHEDITELKLILKYKYDLNISSKDLPLHIINPQVIDDVKEVEEKKSFPEDINEGMTKFVNGTLRSGQVVEYDGNIVIIGDVNPGALIVAKGNIIVLGTLRGVAHAGKGGNPNSVVACYNLQPTQLRIGNIVARPPDEDIKYFQFPEVARIKNNEVIIEPYLPTK